MNASGIVKLTLKPGSGEEGQTFVSRFYSYKEITTREPTPVIDRQWLAGQIGNLAVFQDGGAVLCGSLAWDISSWRSDIDIAHFSTMDHPHIEQEVAGVLKSYEERTEGRFITPQLDVITVGAASMRLTQGEEGFSVTGVCSIDPEAPKDSVQDIFQDAAVRFTDHIGSIAAHKGEPWQAFVNRYLTGVDTGSPHRREAIKSYVGRMTAEWAKSPLHPFNLGPDGELKQPQLDLIAKAENYPVHVMRRLLGDVGAYPSPDKRSDVQGAFAGLAQPWSEELLVAFDPYDKVSDAYEDIVAACRKSESPMQAPAYYEQVRDLFVDLPFVRIQELIWNYLGS